MSERYDLLFAGDAGDAVVVKVPSSDLAAFIAEISAAAEKDEWKGIPVSRLRERFNQISDPSNWKRPLNGVVQRKDFEEYAAAAEFFTGSPLKVSQELPGNLLQVQGPGYYRSVGA